MSEKDDIWQHIDRCIECYSGAGGGIDVSGEPDREMHETMRADLMIAVGMLTALRAVLLLRARQRDG